MSRAGFKGLPAEQAAILSAVCDEWLGAALATGPADRPAAERGVRLAYERAGLAVPGTIVWLDSPLQASFAVAMLQLLRRPGLELDRGGVHEKRPEEMNRGKAAERAPLYAGDEVWKQVWDRIDPPGLREAGEGVRHRISGQPLHQIHVTCWDVGSEVTRRLEYDVSDALHTRAWEYVGEPVLRWVADRLGPMVWADVWPDLRERFPPHGGHVLLKDLLKDYGLEEFFVRVPREVSRLGWHHEWEEPFQAFIGQDSIRSLALYDGLVRLGVNVGEPLDGLVQVARSAGWWYPLEHAAILTERPPVLHLDAEGRLHHPTGPAAVYPDGFAVRARHGKVAPPR